MAGFLTNLNKEQYSPYHHVLKPSGSGVVSVTMTPITGVIGSISIYSDSIDDDATITVKDINGTETAGIRVTAGNTLQGPFTSYDVTQVNGAPDISIIGIEREVSIETRVWQKLASETADSPLAGFGFIDGTPDTFKLATFGKFQHITGFLEVDCSVNSGGAGTGITSLADAEITSISAEGLITFQNGTVFANDFVGTIKYKIKKP